MAPPIIIPQTAEQEAQALLANTAAQIADMLGKSIAALPVMVGLGRAPTEAACMAAATKITEMFGGAVLSAIEGEHAIAQLTARLDHSKWRPIDEAPPGNEDAGPFFDVIWAGEMHRYLPVDRRLNDCFCKNGTIMLRHGYPAVTTIFNPQPTHWRPRPLAPVDDTAPPGAA